MRWRGSSGVGKCCSDVGKWLQWCGQMVVTTWVWWSSWLDVANRGGVMVVDRWVVVVLLMVDRGGLWMGLMVDQGGVVVCARGLFGVWDEFLYWGFWV